MLFPSFALGGLPRLLKFASGTSEPARPIATSGRGFKRLGVGLLVVLMLASVTSMAQSPAPSFTAGTAITNISNAIENGLTGMVSGDNGGGVMSIGRQLFGFFILANLVWMLLKSFFTGAGFFGGFFADLVPFAITAAVVAIFLDRDVASVINQSMNTLAGAVLGTGATATVSDMIAQAGQQALQAVMNVWNVAPATQVTWDPTSWFAAIPVVLWALGGTLGTVFFILVALAIYLANLVMSQVAITIAMIFAPFFVPFLLFSPLSWLFDGWLRFFLGAGMMKIIGLLMLKITSSMMAALVTLSAQAAAAKPGVLDSVSIDIVQYSAMVLLAGISALLMAQVPSLSTGLLSGSSGGAGFGGWSGMASRSPATRLTLGGMGEGSAGGGRNGQPANALSGVTRMMPNIVKPVTGATGQAASKLGGWALAGRDMRTARNSGALNGERNIGRDLTKMSAASAGSYVRRLESMNAGTAAREAGGGFVGPPTPRYTVSKPASSTTPTRNPK